MASSKRTTFDAITLEILWSRLISISDESAAALLRTSFSTIVRESNDFATLQMDAKGDSFAENTAGIPSFVGVSMTATGSPRARATEVPRSSRSGSRRRSSDRMPASQSTST